MDGKKQKRNFAEAVLGEKSPKEHDLPELERLYGVAFDDTARAYAEFKKAGATTYGSLPGKELLDKVIVSSSDTPFARFLKALGSTASDWVRDGHTHFLVLPVGSVHIVSRNSRQILKMRLPPLLMHSISRIFVTLGSSRVHTAEKPRILCACCKPTPPMQCLLLI